ncbi:glutamyl-tRNA reductase [Streptococcus iners]|uniref:Glutamyl-tRNA reductase n=1 Tax=Streptococcus iners TaxID=3028084 RepID=A0AA96VKV4_9STRE|nr:glutamyl-tRNA reductase [Streptococcus sp. 29887]MCK4026112.1 glutamyl-tRNA reductase [Streptococcus suis]WNY50266.1 glutamyl-tRNA reductase [Streptococcus sp. 29887]
MDLLYVGLTHQNTPFSLLERAHFSDEEVDQALRALNQEKSIFETVIVSTCNRTELYLVVDQLHTGRYYAKRFLLNWFQLEAKEVEPCLIFKEADQVLEHLLRVSIGLESKILGETQILGQLKRAFARAQTVGTTGVILNQVFKQVMTFAKRMHEEYRINARPISIGLTAVQMLEQTDFDYSGKTVAVIGLGEIGQLVTKYLLKKPFEQIRLVNRTVSKAQYFLQDQRVQAFSWDQLEAAVADADVVFSAVKVGGYILFPTMLKESVIAFDLCLPRTVHPTEQMTLYTIENLSNQLEVYHEERREIANQIVLEIEDELVKYQEWQAQLGIVPLIRELREKALQIHATSLESINRKIPDLTEREQKQISKHMKGIVNQLIREPILQLKEMSVGERSDYDIALVCKLFGLQADRLGEDYDNN